jgi:hypothetical protein
MIARAARVHAIGRSVREATPRFIGYRRVYNERLGG